MNEALQAPPVTPAVQLLTKPPVGGFFNRIARAGQVGPF
jgi:hypothetical protein